MKKISSLFCCLFFAAATMAQISEGHINYIETGNQIDIGRSVLLRTDHANLDTLTSVFNGTMAYDTLNDVVVFFDGADWVDVGSGGGAADLENVLQLGNQTGGNNINITDGDAIYLDNGSRLRKGITDMSNGGAKGIALVCSIDYELKWEAGRMYILQQDGFTIREARYNFTMTPTVSDDGSDGYTIGSRWILDDGTTFVCSDSTSGSAVWALETLWSQADGVISPVSADIVQANDIRTTGTYKFTTDSLDLGFTTVPFIGSGGSYGDGLFVDGIGDWSALGLPNHFWAGGYLSNNSLSFIQVDTSSVRIRSQNGVAETLLFQSSLEMFRDTSISGVQQLFSLNARTQNLGYVDIGSKVDTKLRLQLSAFDRYDHQISYLGIDTEYVAIIAPLVTIQSDLTVEKYNGQIADFLVRGNGYNSLYFGGSDEDGFSSLEILLNDTAVTDYGQELLSLDVIDGFKVESTNDGGLRSTISVSENSILMCNFGQDTIMISNDDGIIIKPNSGPPIVGDVLTAVSIRGEVEWQTPTTVSSGTYTPTATIITNVSSATPRKCNWSRVGNVVTVSGSVSITTTGIGTTELGLSLPIASDFGTIYEASGNAVSIGGNNHYATLFSDVSNNYVVIKFNHSGTPGSDDFRYVYSYEIL